MKVTFPDLEDLIKEAQSKIRIGLMIETYSKNIRDSKVPLCKFVVVVTAKLNDNEIGEYAYIVSKALCPSRKEVKEHGLQAIDSLNKCRTRIEDLGKECADGIYVHSGDAIYGIHPIERFDETDNSH